MRVPRDCHAYVRDAIVVLFYALAVGAFLVIPTIDEYYAAAGRQQFAIGLFRNGTCPSHDPATTFVDCVGAEDTRHRSFLAYYVRSLVQRAFCYQQAVCYIGEVPVTGSMYRLIVVGVGALLFTSGLGGVVSRTCKYAQRLESEKLPA